MFKPLGSTYLRVADPQGPKWGKPNVRFPLIADIQLMSAYNLLKSLGGRSRLPDATMFIRFVSGRLDPNSG